MNTSELRKKNNEELNNLLLELRREQFNLRMQKGSGQLSKPSEVKRVRRDIARIKTIMNESSMGNK
ncbi:MAG: 50S ribosomal protein L29 [Gammaproteobacteria bacterium RIFCSPLOWO2_02_FULL_47_50]|jgi:large subunit ribosomal protein L29|uniref:Large ribosomal subunit protein uL29 n=2 Tax=environmental samples TaxID=50423 RepID=A0A0H4TGG4_9GAMM|nr:50S ribosomal protein L29 [uncultured gamma proteobacterium Rifle_16ft_4_minimus_39789]AKQ05772.1 50S ribosomal protein L29 [uncultured gamma proteobacterium Rifle_16ft_4_minimus_38164]OGT63869.1 MAG: 50S ribosomal protein L29 [Gammaproteobacteria bacterium RIFCSPLOWO2_02_47_7]OGT64457.1 MAG: 50S ribosomal protein L29 [Gammaproteobacteria bacterium RIFCSPLOWO2_01_FULL_47_190]OGT76760.1 MAG: 50S ribosomal protein L29 [Gammaproteobacteria bacterium RIFCSPLOWO2_12_47_11]OGT80797.1 MAG: 50S rib